MALPATRLAKEKRSTDLLVALTVGPDFRLLAVGLASLALGLLFGCGETPSSPRFEDAGQVTCVDPDPFAGRIDGCSPCRPSGVGGLSGACRDDADCGDGSNGRCVLDRRGSSICSYDVCFFDEDCEEEEVCACDGGEGGGNVCVPANCSSDGDCDDELACAASLSECGPAFPVGGYFCELPEDGCRTNADCTPGFCAFDLERQRRICREVECR